MPLLERWEKLEEEKRELYRELLGVLVSNGNDRQAVDRRDYPAKKKRGRKKPRE